MENQDTHRFGESDYLSADDFAVDATVKVPVKSFVGRKEFIARDGTPRKAGFYNVDDRGAIKDFRLGIKNEKLLAAKFKLKGYEELVGKTLALQVKKYPLGHNGFVIIDVK